MGHGLRRRIAPARPSPALVARCAALGVATGARSTLGIAAPVIATPTLAGGLGAVTGRVGTTVAEVAVGGELVGDKLAATPSRLEGPGLPVRLLAGTAGAAALAWREGAAVTLPVLAAALGVAAGAWGGFTWRGWAAAHVPDWQGALVEDGVALGLAAAACLPRRHAGG